MTVTRAVKRGRPKNPPKVKEIFNNLIPSADIFDAKELEIFNGLVALYMNDFDESQLTANDVDDISSVAMNKVLEIRLLKASRESTDLQIDTSTAIERLRKQTEKLKENLATRRKDRVDPKQYSGLSIVDLAVAFDQNKKDQLLGKVLEYENENNLLRNSDELIGNRNDQDAEVFDVEFD